MNKKDGRFIKGQIPWNSGIKSQKYNPIVSEKRLKELNSGIEKWKIVSEFPSYAVSESGKIKRILTYRGNPSDSNIKNLKLRGGYLYAWFSKYPYTKLRIVHRIVAKEFIQNPSNKREVNHKDGNKENNSVLNLEWVTRTENQAHARLSNLLPFGEKTGNAKLTDQKIRQIRLLSEIGVTPLGLTTLYGVKRNCIYSIKNGQTWTHVE